jgi:O-antigen/teichoic acid export membrane protein
LNAAQVNAAFWVLALFGLLVSTGALAVADLWAKLYAQPGLSAMLTVASTAIALTGFSSVQAALLRRYLRFRALALINLASRSAGSLAAVVLALHGFGGWSLVWQYVLSIAFFSAGVVLATRWWAHLRRPQFSSWRSFGDMLRFAVFETTSQFVASSRARIFLSISAFSLPLAVIGEMNLAFRLVDSLRIVIASAVARLCVALFARKQDNPAVLQALFARANCVIASLTLPPFTALAVCAPELMHVAFGDKWLAVVPQIQVLSLTAILYFSRSAGAYLLTASARPGISLAMNCLALAATAILLVLFPPSSADHAFALWVAPMLLTTVADFFITRQLFGIRIRDQAIPLTPGLMRATMMAGVLVLIKWLAFGIGLAPNVVLTLEAMGGAIAAILLAVSFRTSFLTTRLSS